MDKSVLISLIGLTSTGSGLGITAIFGGFDGDSTLVTLLKDYPALVNQGQLTSEILSQLPSVGLDKSKDIVNNYLKLSCTRYLFKGKKWKDPTQEPEGNKRLDLTESKGESKDSLKLENENVMGCLNVWWEKETFKNSKWKGKWNLVWAMSDGKHGVLLSSTAKAEKGELQVDAQGYTLKKEGGRWETIASKTTDFKKVKEKSDKETLIIQAGSSVENKTNKWWGFSFETTNICNDDNECTSGTKSFSKKSWNFIDRGVMNGDTSPKELKDWSSNFGAWSKKNKSDALMSGHHSGMYANIKGYFQLIAQKP